MAESFKPHPIFARLWIQGSKREDKQGISDHRRETLAGLSGRVLELGCGNGMNFPHYPADVSEVVAIEPEPTLRSAAEDAAAGAGVTIRVVDAVADPLPFEDGSFDAAVASLVLCSVPDQARALAELRRVLRPGGGLRFYEHVQADANPLKSFLAFADRTFWPRVAGGCHASRRTGEAIERAGFEIESCRRFMFSPCALPKTPHIIGSARRP